jgi:Fe2+ transport system protein FeoA
MSPDLIQPHLSCRIRSLGGDSAARLGQMGVLPGIELEIVRTSPFGGGTVQVILGDGDLVALRSDEIASMDCEVVAMPLTSPLVGSGSYVIKALPGGRSFRTRMSDLGLQPGTRVDVLSTSPFVLSVSGAPVRLGRGEAGKIVVAGTPDGET